MMKRMMRDVRRFHMEVLGGATLPTEPGVRMLSAERRMYAMKHLREESEEFAGAETVEDQADALVDIAYVALGRLLEMGILPDATFDAVHEANMRKTAGLNPQRPDNPHDAIKPEGWTPPDLERALSVSLYDVMAMSPVLLEITQLRRRKGRDYNTSVQIPDYFPLGHQSYFQMIFIKTKRIQSLLEVMKEGREANFEGLRDTVLDLLNYAVFYAEWIDAQEEGRKI